MKYVCIANVETYTDLLSPLIFALSHVQIPSNGLKARVILQHLRLFEQLGPHCLVSLQTSSRQEQAWLNVKVLATKLDFLGEIF